MKLKDLAELLGKDVFEVSKMLKDNKVINIQLSEIEKPRRLSKNTDELKIIQV